MALLGYRREAIYRDAMPTIALIVAAGRGERASTGIPKQFALVGGRPLLCWAIEAFQRSPDISEVRVVIGEADRTLYEQAVAGMGLPPPILGGDTRQSSVRNGLEALVALPPQRVLIHDAARPFVSTALIKRVCAALDHAESAAPFLDVTDTLRRKVQRGYELTSRDGLVRAQTPQGFRFAPILRAHRKFAGESLTDDIALAERAGLSFHAVAGEEANMKLTYPEDFKLAERMTVSLFETRVGSGFDVHRFEAGDHVWLCGVRVPHNAALQGHSDADVGLHALTDAILGALAAGDIGVHFPPTDEKWRGAPSHLFLAHAASLLRAKNGVISHVDVTIICERPKLSPHREAMRQRISEILGVTMDRVSVKATTTEGLGFTGRDEGIAAQALATLKLPT